MKTRQTLVCGFLVIMFALMFGGCKGRDPAQGKEEDKYKIMFGSYPVDYTIAYLDIFGYSKVPTIRSLFGPDAVYATTINGTPSAATLESASGSKDEFNAQFLISIKDQNTDENKNLLRVQIQFKAEEMTEKSYVRYVKLANIPTGQITEQRSRGGEYEDGRLVGMFVELMQYIWEK